MQKEPIYLDNLTQEIIEKFGLFDKLDFLLEVRGEELISSTEPELLFKEIAQECIKHAVNDLERTMTEVVKTWYALSIEKLNKMGR